MARFRLTIRKIKIIMVIFILYYIYHIISLKFRLFKHYKPLNMKIKSPGDGYAIKTIGCSIPSLHPFDPVVLPFILKNPPVRCDILQPLVTSDEFNTLTINQSLFLDYNITNAINLNCCYQKLTRRTGIRKLYPELSDETVIISPICQPFQKTTKVKDEFIRVSCNYNAKTIYSDYHSFAPVKQSKAKKPSVLVIGIDSMSRINLHRQMPKTVEYLAELNAHEFFGYNKVADNTFPNLVPALTGKTEFDLYADCLTSKWLNLPTKFDDCKFIWHNYSRAGFLTAFAEDVTSMGLFNYGHKVGFRYPPADYYWAPFDYAYENELGWNPYNDTINICVGPRRIYRELLEYMKRVIFTLKRSSFFGWFWQCSITHNEMNLASVSDEDYKQMFQSLAETNVLNNTFVVFLSDHGPRSGSILLTHQGFLENRLPFLYVLVPPWFRELHPIAALNLKRNTKRLVTTFDIHETLNDLIYVEKLTDDNLFERTNVLRDTRGISLFLPISERRTCASAGIATHWCSCFQSNEINVDNEEVKSIARFIVNYIKYVLLANQNKCAILSLDYIISARLLVAEEFVDMLDILRPRPKLFNYVVALRTQPGGAIFESTVRCYSCGKTGDFEIQGGISRLNTYGSTGDCLQEGTLRKYCLCDFNSS